MVTVKNLNFVFNVLVFSAVKQVFNRYYMTTPSHVDNDSD